ncbi:MAG: arginyltransferase [Hyphomicrobiaceae bacterium]|nr:arginyltransferase [Hyphomicrobiaceae bacterium]
MTEQSMHTSKFFLTAPAECPYLAGREERKIFTHLSGKTAGLMAQVLAEAGFRRSQSLIYRPACEGCAACTSVRVVADEFDWTRRYLRVMRKNAGVRSAERPAITTNRQFDLFQRYLFARHRHGGMANMTRADYEFMVEDTPIDTMIVEYFGADAEGHDSLIGVALTDRMSDGLSMVYSFYDPELAGQSLGTFMILDHINRAKAAGLGYLYLGYWVPGSPKMAYKTQFEPIEALRDHSHWERLASPEAAPAGTTHG